MTTQQVKDSFMIEGELISRNSKIIINKPAFTFDKKVIALILIGELIFAGAAYLGFKSITPNKQIISCSDNGNKTGLKLSCNLRRPS